MLEGTDWDTLARLAVALGIGGLIGLERERHHKEKSVLAGVRTLPLVALSGVLLTLLAETTGETLLLVAGMAVFGAFALLMALGRQEEDAAAGLTTPVAFVATFILGILVGHGFLLVAIIAAVAITVLLFSKRRLHHLAEVMTEPELRGAVMFIILAFILYPLAPSEPVGPAGGVNLQYALLIVILVSALSFVSFLAMRRYGPKRGLPMMGLLGGLASSMAAVAAIAGLRVQSPGLRAAAVLAILSAAFAMLVRNLAIAVIADPSLRLALMLLLPFLAMAVLLAGAVFLRHRRSLRDAVARAPAAEGAEGAEATEDPLPAGLVESPFAIRPALRFGLLFLGVSWLASLLMDLTEGAEAAVYVTAAGGLVATGPVVASMALLAAQGTLTYTTAATVSVLAAVLSLFMKAALAHAARGRLGPSVPPVLVLAALAGGAAVLAIRWIT